jgi:hypothetical protein
MKTRKSCSIAFGHSHLWMWWVDTTHRPTAGVKPPSEQCNGGESWVGWLFGAVEKKRFHRPCKSREESLPKPYALRLWFGVGITNTIVISPPVGERKAILAITSTNKPGETWFRTFGRFVSCFLFEIRDTEPTNKCKNDMWISPADYDYTGTMSTQCRHFKGDFSSKTWLKIGSRGIVSKQNTSFKQDSLHSGLPGSSTNLIKLLIHTHSRSCWLLWHSPVPVGCFETCK